MATDSIKEVRVEALDGSLGGRISLRFFVLSFVGLVMASVFAVTDPSQFAFSWLWAFTVAFTICVGCIFWVVLHNATDSEWGVLVRRQMENLGVCVVWLPLLFTPLIVFFGPILWKWWSIPHGADSLLDAKRSFLNKPFFVLRTVGYFLALGWVALMLRRHSVEQDSDGLSSHTFLMRKVAIAGLPVLGVCLTFAAVDWLMGLDHHWFSTMWGVYIFAGSAGASMAVLVLVCSWLRSRGYLELLSQEHFHVMGKFLLAFTVFWAYIGYSQYMLIWYANIPEETVYFKIRNTESWHLLSSALVAGRFFLPFPFLLFQSVKKRTGVLVVVSAWILVMHLLDIYLVVLPSHHPAGFAPSLCDLGSLLCCLGFLFGVFFRVMSKVGLFPSRDPRLSGSVGLAN